MSRITRNVWILSMVSLFTDLASEMLYPIMPLYLKSIGFSILIIGVLEGFAEATAGLSKGYFGALSDKLGRRLPFVQIGYSFSAISKPMMAIFIYPLWIFFARAIDRLGKGIRTGARDALLSDETIPAYKAQVFGFHRSMDTLGAVLGPSVALFFLMYHPGSYKPLFLYAFIPGLLAVAITLFIKEKKKLVNIPRLRPKFFDFIKYWQRSSPKYRKLTGVLLVFTLFNSSDVFLLLKIKASGLNDTTVIGIYIFYNLVYALFSYPLGLLADKIGMKKVFLVGIFFYVLVYTGMGLTRKSSIFFLLFFLYGVYAAATEGIAKAWITNICKREDTATAIGTFTGFQSICTLFASSIAGVIWFSLGASATFFITSAGAVLVFIFLYKIKFSLPVQVLPDKN